MYLVKCPHAHSAYIKHHIYTEPLFEKHSLYIILLLLLQFWLVMCFKELLLTIKMCINWSNFILIPQIHNFKVQTRLLASMYLQKTAFCSTHVLSHISKKYDIVLSILTYERDHENMVFATYAFEHDRIDFFTFSSW